MSTVVETYHLNIKENVLVCSDRSDKGMGYASENFDTDESDERIHGKIYAIGSKPLPIRLKAPSAKVKELWGALSALRDFRTTLKGCDITFS